MGSAIESRKMRAAKLSVAAAFILSVLKISAGFLFNSLGILSAGVDSIMDLLASSINFFSMKKSIQPADPEHPYGHGKIENIATLFQATLLGIMGVLLIGEGFRQALHGKNVPDLDAGIGVMVISGLAAFWVGKRLERVGRETDSPLLQADAFHFTMDTYTNGGVAAALIVARWTGWIVLDRIVAILIGIWILFSAFKILRNSLDALMDKYIPEDLQARIDRIILSHAPQIMGYHKMRSRRAGSQKLIDLHLVVCRDRSLSEAHSIADHIEKEIEAQIQSSDVIIHVEPCNQECPSIREECEFLCTSQS